MKLPSMKFADGISKSKQVKFGGLNHTAGAGDGELWDMKNMTSDHHPVLASRSKRYRYRKLNAPGGIFSWEGLCWVDGEAFYFAGEKKGTVSAGKKEFTSIGATILIFPDKCYYNTETGVFGSMEARWSGNSLTFGNGQLYGETAEANCISCQGVKWENYFRSGDAVTISGCTAKPGNNLSLIIRSIDGDKMYFYENSFTIGENGEAYTEQGNLSIARTVPDLDFLCEHENRVWGCKGNTIYASKLGDFFNWNVYDGLDTDAWAVDTGSAGDFTGCISYRGYATFFKEDNIYKVYGTFPSNFQVMGSATIGLAAGSEGSLAVAGETLFYLSRNGITAYTGGIPQPVAQAFGKLRFQNAVAGSDGLKYYVSMQELGGNWGLYVFDTQQGLWHKEDEIQAVGFAYWDGNLYLMEQSGDVHIIGTAKKLPNGVTEEENVEWMAEFADFTEKDSNRKGVGKIQIRLELDPGASMQVWIQFDTDGNWQKVGSAIGEGVKRSYYLPIIPRRGDHYRLKLTGVGGCRVHSLVREYYSGSEY